MRSVLLDRGTIIFKEDKASDCVVVSVNGEEVERKEFKDASLFWVGGFVRAHATPKAVHASLTPVKDLLLLLQSVEPYTPLTVDNVRLARTSERTTGSCWRVDHRIKVEHPFSYANMRNLCCVLRAILIAWEPIQPAWPKDWLKNQRSNPVDFFYQRFCNLSDITRLSSVLRLNILSQFARICGLKEKMPLEEYMEYYPKDVDMPEGEMCLIMLEALRNREEKDVFPTMKNVSLDFSQKSQFTACCTKEPCVRFQQGKEMPTWAKEFKTEDYENKERVPCLLFRNENNEVAYATPQDDCMLEDIERVLSENKQEFQTLSRFGVSVSGQKSKLRDLVTHLEYDINIKFLTDEPQINGNPKWLENKETQSNRKVKFFVRSRTGKRFLADELQEKVQVVFDEAVTHQDKLGNNSLSCSGEQFTFNLSRGTLIWKETMKQAKDSQPKIVKETLFHVGATITPTLLSAPYKKEPEDKGSLSKYFHLPHCATEIDKELKNVFEREVEIEDGRRVLKEIEVSINGVKEQLTIVLDSDDISGYVFHRITAKCDNTSEMKDFSISSEDGEIYLLDGEMLPREELNKRDDITEGLCMWLVDDEPLKDYREVRKPRFCFRVKPFSLELSKQLEEAKLEGKDTEVFKYNNTEYVANLSHSRMTQHQRNEPYRERRIWRFGSILTQDLIKAWSCCRKLRGTEIPEKWGKDSPRYIRMDPKSDEYKFVLEMIHSSVDSHNEQPSTIPFNYGGNWFKQTGKMQSDRMEGVVHFIDSNDSPQKKDPRAIHVAAIYRIQNCDQWRSYRAKINETYTVRGRDLMEQPSPRYLAKNPLATGPFLDDRANEVWAFNGTNSEFAVKLIDGVTEQSVRASSTFNTFGQGLYYSDDFIKIMKYCACPKCKGSARNATSSGEGKCVCKDRNLTHPYVAFLTRITLGNFFVTRDRPSCSLYGDLGGSVFRLERHPLALWYDPSKDTETDAREYTSKMFPDHDFHCKPFSYPDFMGALRVQGKPVQVHLFYIKNATKDSSEFTSFIEFMNRSDEKLLKDSGAHKAYIDVLRSLFKDSSNESIKNEIDRMDKQLLNDSTDYSPFLGMMEKCEGEHTAAFIEITKKLGAGNLLMDEINKLDIESLKQMPEFKSFIELLKKNKRVLKGLTAAIILENDNVDAKELARNLQKTMTEHGADGCFYRLKECPSFKEFISKLNANSGEQQIEAMKEYFRKYMTTDPTLGTLELRSPRVFYKDSKPNWRFETVDAALIEDMIHCSAEMIEEFPLSLPSIFDARENKHREIVVFDGNRVYSEYAIMFYQYESKEAMLNNIPKEFPQNHHGVVDEESIEDPLFFVRRDFGIGSSSNPEEPPVEGPDDDSFSKPIKEQMQSGPSSPGAKIPDYFTFECY